MARFSRRLSPPLKKLRNVALSDSVPVKVRLRDAASINTNPRIALHHALHGDRKLVAQADYLNERPIAVQMRGCCRRNHYGQTSGQRFRHNERMSLGFAPQH
jgi:hypothetical protein